MARKRYSTTSCASPLMLVSLINSGSRNATGSRTSLAHWYICSVHALIIDILRRRKWNTWRRSSKRISTVPEPWRKYLLRNLPVKENKPTATQTLLSFITSMYHWCICVTLWASVATGCMRSVESLCYIH